MQARGEEHGVSSPATVPRGGACPHWRACSVGAAAVAALIALTGGIALVVLVALLKPEPVAVVAGLVISRYVVIALFLRAGVRLVRAEEAVVRDPTRADLYFELAFTRLERGRAGEAVRAFRQGVGLDPDLDMDRPGELAERLLARVGIAPLRRRELAYLMTAALFDRMLEHLEDTLPAGVAAPAVGARGAERVLTVRDVARRLSGRARLRFVEHCTRLVDSLRVEIAGLEQLVVALDGEAGDAGEDEAVSGRERERQRQALDVEIERLRAHAGELDSAIRHALREREKEAGDGSQT